MDSQALPPLSFELPHPEEFLQQARATVGVRYGKAWRTQAFNGSSVALPDAYFPASFLPKAAMDDPDNLLGGYVEAIASADRRYIMLTIR